MSGAAGLSPAGISGLRVGREVGATGWAAHASPAEAAALLLDSLAYETLLCSASELACFLGDSNLQSLPRTFRSRPGILMPPVPPRSALCTVMGGNPEASPLPQYTRCRDQMSDHLEGDLERWVKGKRPGKGFSTMVIW